MKAARTLCGTAVPVTLVAFAFGSPGVLHAADSGNDLSTPEKTVAAYYRAYRECDKDLLRTTFLMPAEIEGMGRTALQSYRALEKRQVLKSQHEFEKPGDILITTQEFSVEKASGRTYSGRLTFWLRPANGAWKIAGHIAHDTD